MNVISIIEIEDSEVVDNVEEELNRLSGCDHDDWLCLDPFGEFVHHNEEMCVAPRCLLQGPD